MALKYLASILTLLSCVVVSCKKERSCVCTTISQGITSLDDSLLAPNTKKKAKEECSNLNDGGDDGIGGVYYTTCELK